MDVRGIGDSINDLVEKLQSCEKWGIRESKKKDGSYSCFFFQNSRVNFFQVVEVSSRIYYYYFRFILFLGIGFGVCYILNRFLELGLYSGYLYVCGISGLGKAVGSIQEGRRFGN